MIHYTDVIISAMASQITGVSAVCSTVCSGAVKKKYQSSAALAFVRGIHRVTRGFPSQRASNAENVSIWWRHHAPRYMKRVVLHHVPCSLNELTLNVRGPGYLGLTRSISWLLMPWLLTSPGYQQPWYWLPVCRICRSWSYLRKDINYLCHINVE